MISLKYIGRRFVTYGISIFLAVTVIFLIPRLIPGDPISVMVNQMAGQSGGGLVTNIQELIDNWKNRFGLGEPLEVQYWKYWRQILQGDLGISIMGFPTSVSELIARGLPWSIGLLSLTVIINFSLGSLVGVLFGWFSESKVASILAATCIFFSQIPYYLLAILLVFGLGYMIPLFPTSGAYDQWTSPGLNLRFISSVLQHAILPSLSMIVVGLGGYATGMRAVTVNIKGEDFVTFAKARGLKKTTILMKYAFRNAMLPNVTNFAMSLGHVVSGSILVEYVFSYPGIGSLFAVALGYLDYNVMMGILLLLIVSVLTANLIVDLLLPIIDPRIKYERD